MDKATTLDRPQRQQQQSPPPPPPPPVDGEDSGPGAGGGDGHRKPHRHRHRHKHHGDVEEEEDGHDGGDEGDGGHGGHGGHEAPATAAAVSPASSPHRSQQQQQQEQQPQQQRTPASSPLRPLVIDSPRLNRHHSPHLASGSDTPGRSPSRRRHERRAKHTKAAAGRMRKRSVLCTFLVGVVFGAWLLLRTQHLGLFPNLYLPPAFNISAVLPTGIADVNSTILNDIYGVFSALTPSETYPGKEAAARGLKAHYPIVLIPGFITTGLEVWQGEACASSLFRSRLWGALTMLQTMLMKPDCWTQHMALDMETGLDPPGIRIRPAQGLEAADYFMPGFWVWSKLILDFAAIGYDHSNLVLMSYDWRLSLHDLERRDKYFSFLKSRIETLVRVNGGRKVVMLAHSYGSNVMIYFFAWVESKRGGNGGRSWVSDHIHIFVNIAGPLLGVIKAATSYISGEMHDTAEMGPLEGILFQESNAFHRSKRRKLFRTWGSLTAMLPKGGEALWGNLTHAPDDVDIPLLQATPGPETLQQQQEQQGEEQTCLPTLSEANDSFVEPKGKDAEPAQADEGSEACVTPAEAAAEPLRLGQVIGFTGGGSSEAAAAGGGGESAAPARNWTVDDVIEYLRTDPEDPHLRRRMTEDYDFGYVADFKRHAHVKDDPKYWTNPLAVQLPRATKMRILCYYGVGKPTERAYLYRADAEGKIDAIDSGINDPLRNISGGVVMSEGDGTVTLNSLGFHCAHLWRQRSHNPSGISVTTRELWHTTSALLSLTRTSQSSGDHVDIMGNSEMAADLLKIVSGMGDEEVVGQDRFFSRINEIAAQVELE